MYFYHFQGVILGKVRDEEGSGKISTVIIPFTNQDVLLIFLTALQTLIN